MRASRPALVYKVLPRTDWDVACRSGSYAGSADDLRDGFIHLSAVHQLAGTLAKHFSGVSDLVLVAFDPVSLGPDLRWEPSRGGDLFPHLFGPLPCATALATRDLALRADGVPVLPEDLGSC